MLICFCGSGEPEEKVVRDIIKDVRASQLLALPNNKLEDMLTSIFKDEEIDYEVYGIASWMQRAEKAVKRLKANNGQMILFPESRKTLNTHEDYMASLCKEYNVSLLIV